MNPTDGTVDSATKHTLFATVCYDETLLVDVADVRVGCRKGKRECTYPGTTASTPKPSRSTSKSKGSPDGSSLSESDIEPDSALPLSAIPDDEDEDAAGEDDPQATTPESRKPSESSLSLIDKSTSPSTEASATAMRSARPQPVRTSSKQSIKAEYSQSGRWASLPKDVKYYLKYHRENMSHHHYAFKYDGSDFLRTTFVEIALNDSSAALLYAIVAFAAYHHSIARDDSKISSFLTFYNKSIAYLQQSLKNKRHNVATLLTILTLATVEVRPRARSLRFKNMLTIILGVSRRLGESSRPSKSGVPDLDRPLHAANDHAR